MTAPITAFDLRHPFIHAAVFEGDSIQPRLRSEEATRSLHGFLRRPEPLETALTPLVLPLLNE